jgi:hypothetical protein
MKQRYAISEYEELWQSDPQRYGGIPLQKAIDSLLMDAQSVSMLVERGVLECFEIGDDSDVIPMVSLQSLLLFKSAKAASTQDRPDRILQILTEAAKAKKTLYYGDVMKTVGLTYKESRHRQTFTAALREAVKKSELFEHGLLLSALLVYKIQYIPDEDFFDMARELGFFTPGKDPKTVFFKDQLERIFEFYEKKQQ